jgi:hypothetical protein
VRLKKLTAIAACLFAMGVFRPEIAKGEAPATAPQVETLRWKSSPDDQFVAYEGATKDGRHNTIWIENLRAGATIDACAPEDEKWPGVGEAEILDWLDDNRLAFTTHCGTGCTSLEVFDVKDHSHWYFCMSGSFYLSPDKQWAVGQVLPMELGGVDGGLALIKLSDGHRDEPEDECKLILSGTGLCESGVNGNTFKFDRWKTSDRSFTYRVYPCESKTGEIRVFDLECTQTRSSSNQYASGFAGACLSHFKGLTAVNIGSNRLW